MPIERKSSLDGGIAPPGLPAGGRLSRLGRRCAQQPRLVVAAWIVVLILATLGNGAFGGVYSDNFTLPNSPSEQGAAVLKAHDPRQGGQGGQLVFTVTSGTLTADRTAIDTAIANVSRTAHVLSVSNPFSTGTVSKTGRTAVATVHFDTNPQRLGRGYVAQIDTDVAPARSAGVSVNYGGALGQAASPKSKDGDSSLIGIVIALLVLLVGFGSVYAAGLPLLSAGLATFSGIGVLGIVAASASFPKVSPTFATMMGLGVGIDYTLFLCTRYRQRLMDGLSPSDAVAQTLATSGRAVLVAATTVIVALLSLYVSGISFMGQLGVAGAVAVAVGALAAVTLVPALLGLIGNRIDRHQVRAPVAESTAGSPGWGHYARRVGAHPWRFLVGGTALLCVLAIPFFSMRLGHIDAGAGSANTTAKRAYDQITTAFGQGVNGIYTIAVSLPGGVSGAEIQTLETKLDHALRATPDVAQIRPAHPNSSGDVLVASVIPRSSPQEQATDTLQATLRDKTLPGALAGSGAKGYVTGSTSEQLDFRNQITSRLPLIVAVVVVIAFLLLLVNFRSPVLALKAAVLNLLSIGAAYGVVVAVFQWGWGGSLLGLSEKVPIESYVPMLMFAVVFGLSMDYEVFLLSRVRESWLRTGDNHASVAAGLSATARVITCAALIMTGVFLAFMLSSNIVVKMLALGLGASILIDATVIRLVVVPAAMFLLGRYNWWTPAWLERLLPGGEPRAPAAKPSTGTEAAGTGPTVLPRRRQFVGGAVSWVRNRAPRQLAGLVAAVLGIGVITAFALTMLTTGSASSQTQKSKGRLGGLVSSIAGTVGVTTVRDASLSSQLSLAGTVGGSDGAAQITPQTPGTVTSLSISAGQKVRAGQVIARLSDTQGLHAKQAAAQGQLSQAQAALAQAQHPQAQSATVAQATTQLTQAQAALSAAQHPQAQPTTVAQAKTQLTQAQAVLSAAQHPQSQPTTVAQAKSQLTQAQAALSAAQHPQAQPASVAQAQVQVQTAQSALDDAEAKQSSDEASRASAQQLAADATAVQDAHQQLSAAQTALNTVQNPPPAPAAVINADQAAVTAAQQALTSLEHPTGATSEVVSADQAAVTAAQQAVNSLEHPKPASASAIAADKAAVAAAQQAVDGLEHPEAASASAIAADEAAVTAAQNNLDAANQAVSQLTVTAPVSGTIAQILVPVGGYAGPTSPIATLTGSTEMITAQASPAQLASLDGHLGAKATVSLAVPSSTNDPQATLTQIAPSASATTQQTAVTFTTKTALQSNAPVSVTVQVPGPRRPIVPTDAIVNSGGRQGVYVVTGILNPAVLGIKLPASVPDGVELGRAAFTPIRTGVSQNGSTQVLSGLTASEQVVTTGQTDLAAKSGGERVAILPSSPKPAGASTTTSASKTPASTKGAASKLLSRPGAAKAIARGIDVTVVSAHGSTLTVKTPLGDKSFKVPTGFKITHDGQPIPLDQLHPGDVLKVTFTRVSGKLAPATAKLQ